MKIASKHEKTKNTRRIWIQRKIYMAIRFRQNTLHVDGRLVDDLFREGKHHFFRGYVSFREGTTFYINASIKLIVKHQMWFRFGEIHLLSPI